jgi:hypothetical protein
MLPITPALLANLNKSLNAAFGYIFGKVSLKIFFAFMNINKANRTKIFDIILE